MAATAAVAVAAVAVVLELLEARRRKAKTSFLPLFLGVRPRPKGCRCWGGRWCCAGWRIQWWEGPFRSLPQTFTLVSVSAAPNRAIPSSSAAVRHSLSPALKCARDSASSLHFVRGEMEASGAPLPTPHATNGGGILIGSATRATKPFSRRKSPREAVLVYGSGSSSSSKRGERTSEVSSPTALPGMHCPSFLRPRGRYPGRRRGCCGSGGTSFASRGGGGRRRSGRRRRSVRCSCTPSSCGSGPAR
jgi:hypothetical protein